MAAGAGLVDGRRVWGTPHGYWLTAVDNRSARRDRPTEPSSEAWHDPQVPELPDTEPSTDPLPLAAHTFSRYAPPVAVAGLAGQEWGPLAGTERAAQPGAGTS